MAQLRALFSEIESFTSLARFAFEVEFTMHPRALCHLEVWLGSKVGPSCIAGLHVLETWFAFFNPTIRDKVFR